MVREDAEALRRRLYAPGAAVDDVDRYRAAGGGSEATPPAPSVSAPSPIRRRRILIAAVVVAALVVAAIGVARSTAQPKSTGPAPTPLAVSADDRQSLENSLANGNAAGIAAYLLTTPTLPRFARATRFDTHEYHGVGDGLVALAPVSAAAFEGRATVLLVLEVPAEAGWTTERRRVDPSGEQEYVRQVHRASRQQAGVITVHTYRYASGDRPVELRVDVPDGVRWGAAVVFSD